jgi:hypothetical protein
MGMEVTKKNPLTYEPYDRASYTRGWKAGHGEGSGYLDRADARREPDAWYDGYEDAAAGREKWHRLNCAAHHNGPGGCGEA